MLKLAHPRCQFIIFCDASFYAAGFILLIDEYLESEEQSRDKTYAPVSLGSRLFSLHLNTQFLLRNYWEYI